MASKLTVPPNIEELVALKRYLDSLTTELNTVIDTLSEGRNQNNIPKLTLPLVTISASYVKAQSEQLASQIQEIQSTLNAVVASLEQAKIISI